MSVLSFLPLLLLPLPISKSKGLHLLMMKQLLHICTTWAFPSKQKIMHSPTFFLFVPDCVTLFLITPVVCASAPSFRSGVCSRAGPSLSLSTWDAFHLYSGSTGPTSGPRLLAGLCRNTTENAVKDNCRVAKQTAGRRRV